MLWLVKIMEDMGYYGPRHFDAARLPRQKT
jgi:hypothetical protein